MHSARNFILVSIFDVEHILLGKENQVQDDSDVVFVRKGYVVNIPY